MSERDALETLPPLGVKTRLPLAVVTYAGDDGASVETNNRDVCIRCIRDGFDLGCSSEEEEANPDVRRLFDLIELVYKRVVMLDVPILRIELNFKDREARS